MHEFLDITAKSQSQAPTENQVNNSSFFHGKFRKYSSKLDGVGYILKVEQAEYPELPAMEFLCNKIYDILHIPIPDYYLIRFPENQACFVTKNFMHDLVASTLDHIYHFVKPGMPYDCETLITIIGDQTGRRSEQEKLAYLTLADSLIGNHDRHGRNLGFIRSTRGISLAPFYDNPSAIGIEDASFLGADLQPKGTIYTKASQEPSMRDYIKEWQRLGYGEVISQFQHDIQTVNLDNVIQASFLSDRRKNALMRLITKRKQELCEILK